MVIMYMVHLLVLAIIIAPKSAVSYAEGTTWEFRTATSLNDTPSLPELPQNIPVILWWTKHVYPHIKSFEVKTCPNSKCYATNERNYLKHNQTRAVYFYGSDFDVENLPLPRLPSHLWGLVHEESPLNKFVLDHTVSLNLFNYTSTYSRHSDYPLPLLSFPSEDFIVNRPPVKTSLKNNNQKSKGYAPVVYVQSHCEVPSDRDRYIQELMKYIRVDSYGKL